MTMSNRKTIIFIISALFILKGILEIVQLVRNYQFIHKDMIILIPLPLLFTFFGIFLFFFKNWARIGILITICILGLSYVLPSVIAFLGLLNGNVVAIIPPVLFYSLLFIIFKFLIDKRTILLFPQEKC